MDRALGKFSKHFIIEKAEYSQESSSHHERAWIWKNIVLLSVTVIWPSQHYHTYFNTFWDIFCERRKQWEQVYFVVDANNMPVQSEEFRIYVKKNWYHLIEREDFCLCIVESKAMKRAIWRSIYKLLGRQDKVKMFTNHNQALRWIQTKCLSRSLSGLGPAAGERTGQLWYDRPWPNDW